MKLIMRLLTFIQIIISILSYIPKRSIETDWIDKHPGGASNVKKVFSDKHKGKDLSEIWTEEGYGWHNSNPNVAAALKRYEI